MFGIELRPGNDVFLLVAKIAENSPKLIDFEEKGTLKLGHDGSASVGFKGTS